MSVPEAAAAATPLSTRRPRLLERYAAFLPVSEATPSLTLGEGGTPLLHARRLGRLLGCERLYLKVEGANPTGSFKDRGMVLAVARAMEQGATAIACASTGNTAASAAAYGAAAGLEVLIILPAGFVAAGKLLQAQVAGARIVAVEANFDRALQLVRELVGEGHGSDREGSGHQGSGRRVALVNSLNPDRLEGQKTGAFEVCDELGRAPDVLAIPVGNAGNISAYWAGFRQYQAAGRVDGLPVMLGFQAEGAAPLVHGGVVAEPRTVATAIRIGDPASRELALRARDESGGRISAVSDAEILEAYRDLARHEGIFCEPASAASVAGVRRSLAEGVLDPEATIVCVLTGHGLKDPATAERVGRRPMTVPADLERVMEALRP